jgi:hypothetical protein
VAAAGRAAFAATLLACAGCGAHHGAAGCDTAQVHLATGTAFSEKTGQHTLEIDVINAAGRSCTVDGYPTISFAGPDGSTLPFRYSHTPDQMIPAQAARLLTIRRAAGRLPRQQVPLRRRALAKAASLRVQLPGARQPTSSPCLRAPVIGYCRGRPHPGHLRHRR